MNLAVKALLLIVFGAFHSVDARHVDGQLPVTAVSLDAEGVVEPKHPSQREQIIFTSQLSEIEVSAAAQGITYKDMSMIILRQTGELPAQDINAYSALIEKFSEVYVDSELISIPSHWQPPSGTQSLMLRDVSNTDISLNLKCCSLRSLYIWSKGVNNIDVSGDLGSLRAMHLSGDLVGIDADWSSAKKLRSIVIGHAHRLENLPEDLLAGGSVRQFIILNTPVKKFPDLTHAVESLESMTIENAKISFFPENLTKINFRGRASFTIPEDVDVKVHPSICDGSFKWKSIRFVNACK
ncbi:MAG: hypothetical protein Alpg2KO_08620 [Alphaproteobacteria bacterium]